MAELYKKLANYNDADYVALHMPGHKRRQALPDAPLLSDLFSIDITEIDGFDDLHHPTGIIKDLQEKAARLYHTEHTYFLVNGSTCGILAAISSVTEQNKKIIVARNCHKSVYHAIFLCGLEAGYIWPEQVDAYDLSGAVTEKEVARAVKENPDAAAIVITSPTYDGICSDFTKIIQIAHEANMAVIVDEAHGAHFSLSEYYPNSALDFGADVVIHSTHKTLPALTQTALLHLQGGLVKKELIERYLSIYQTSSPSYVFMASIEASLSYMEKRADEDARLLIERRNRFYENCKNLKRIVLVSQEVIKDPGKIVISVKGTKQSGSWLAEQLIHQYKIQVEMSAATYVIAMISAFNEESDFERLTNALYEIDQTLQPAPGDLEPVEAVVRPKIEMSIEKAWKSKYELRELSASEGKISGSFVYAYPPGIPMITPGELLNEDVIRQICKARDLGLNIIGLEGNQDSIKTLL